MFFDEGVCTVKDKKTGFTVASLQKTANNLYPLELFVAKESAMVAKVSDSRLWHLRYGHLHEKGLKLLNHKEMVTGLPMIETLELCEGCIYGKQTRRSFPINKAKRAEQCLEVVHADLCGPMQTVSLGGSRYFFLLTDDFSRMSWVYFLEVKATTFQTFQKFKAFVEKQSGLKLKVLRTDRGGEFTSLEFNQFCEREGIHHELTTAYTPEQNGVAERKNRTVVEMARSMMKHKSLPNKFWAESVRTSVYLLNLSPTKAVMNRTPYEAWTGNKPSVSHLKVFGSICYSLIDAPNRKKLDEKSKKCIFVGYSSQSKGYRLYDPVSEKVIESRNVVFDEVGSWKWRKDENGDSIELILEDDEEQRGCQNTENGGNTPAMSPVASTLNSPASNSSGRTTIEEGESSSSPPLKFRSLQDIYEQPHVFFSADPVRFAEAAVKKVWVQAMEEELAAITKNRTWDLVKLPKGKHSIGVKWVFKTKYLADGTLHKYKTRLVVKGYAQEYGIDYEETFSPVARFDTVRTLLALGAYMNWNIFQFDVMSAFFNGDLLEEVYVDQPDGFVVEGKEYHVYRLHKALYGLKQAPRAWYNKLNAFFFDSGFEKSKSEPTLYVKVQGGNILIVCVYVDDIIYLGSCSSLIEEFRSSMMQKFEMSDMGLMHFFLGLEVKQEPDGIFVSQQKYVIDMLKKFNMRDCNPVDTPMNASEKLQKEDGTEEADATLYRSLVGGLIYLTHTRPDISYSVGVISRYMHCPTKQHLGAAKRLLRYIAGTADYGLWYDRGSSFELVCYTDSDWGGCLDDRKSTSGYVFYLGSRNISWSSKKQDVTALSSSEAEYTAANSAAQQEVWLRRILEDIGQKQQKETEVFCDNKGAIAMTKNPAFHGRTKHIQTKIHYIRDLVKKGFIEVKYCNTEEQNADILTKALAVRKFVFFRDRLGVCRFESREDIGI